MPLTYTKTPPTQAGAYLTRRTARDGSVTKSVADVHDLPDGYGLGVGEPGKHPVTLAAFLKESPGVEFAGPITADEPAGGGEA